MADFVASMGKQQELSEEAQVKVGRSAGQKMGAAHEKFMEAVLRLLDTKEIDLLKPETLLRKDVYDALDESWKDKVDQALANIVDLLSHIVEFRLSKKTPDEAPELESMIEHLWQMKQRIEETHDVFKF